LAYLVRDDCPDCAGGGVFHTSNEDGSAFTLIRGLLDGNAHDFDWAPDAKRFAATVKAGYAYESGGRIAVGTPGGSSARELTGSGASFPRWSPKGEEIAFLMSDGIYVTHVDGTGIRRILAVDGVRGIDW
jgi:dipeptidyl aminopeptidase/acylaminoacyl peptidase